MKRRRPHLWIGGAFLGALIIFLLLSAAASPTPVGAVLSSLPLGWWHFLKRNAYQVTWNWGLIATGFICSIGVVVLGNWLLRTLSRQIQQTLHRGQPLRRWRWRWTVCLYGGLWLLFAIAFGAAGVLRHTTWLMSYRQPWYQVRANSIMQFRMMEGELLMLSLENDEDLTATRRAFYTQRSNRRRQTLMSDEFDVIFYGDRSNKVAAYVMIPREPKLAAKGEFGVSIPDHPYVGSYVVRPVSELQRTMAELDAKYPRPEER